MIALVTRLAGARSALYSACAGSSSAACGTLLDTGARSLRVKAVAATLGGVAASGGSGS